MRVAVVGYSVEGVSAAKYWQSLDHEVTVLDTNPDLDVPVGLGRRLGPEYLSGLDQYDLIVRSPGVKPRDITAANPDLDYAKVTSVTNQFLQECPAKVIGVTGTKGKGTTSTLIAKILEAAGHKVHLGGNIGVPALDFLSDVEPDDLVVLELSSFQLIDCRTSPHVGVMLMMAPDHQDWHSDMQEYRLAKQNLFKFQQPGDRAIYNACNVYSLEAGLSAPGDQIAYLGTDGAWVDGDTIKFQDQVICQVSDVALPGWHNLENICAAITAIWPLLENAEPIIQALKSFAGLEHRLEKVAEINGVTYVNDSYAANPQPTLAALKAYEAPKVLILGGYDRGQDYSGLIEQLPRFNMRGIVLLGQTAAQLKRQLAPLQLRLKVADGNIKEVVGAAASMAQPGDVVLLSPGAPSFDMFKNFSDRGVQFKSAVHQLEKTQN